MQNICFWCSIPYYFVVKTATTFVISSLGDSIGVAGKLKILWRDARANSSGSIHLEFCVQTHIFFFFTSLS